MQATGSSGDGSAPPAAAAAWPQSGRGPPLRGSTEVTRSSLELPPGDDAEPVSEPAAAERIWSEYNAPAAKRRRLRRSPYFRRGVQCAAGTAAIMAVISVPAVHAALGVIDPTMGQVFILGEGVLWVFGPRSSRFCGSSGGLIKCLVAPLHC